ncbi:glycosyltransferase [Priestia megaterium]|uniref:glycosyltransferase n=1 Tax=Priestia megaterium TaxID=1404 RepID=UPI00398F9A8A
MKVFFFVRNKKYRPSTHYRTMQYINNFDDYDVIEYETNKYYENTGKKTMYSRFTRIYYGFIVGYFRRLSALRKVRKNKDYSIFVQREIFPRYVDPIGRYLLKKVFSKANHVYWDIDDNIFEAKEISKHEEKILNKYTSKIIAGNSYLKDKIEKKYHNKVEVVNTTDKMMEGIDVNKINIKRLEMYDHKVVIVWVGTRANLPYLNNIVNYLEEAAKSIKEKDIVLKVVSNGSIDIKTTYLKIENIVWERELALQEMLEAHIGLMPLANDEITKGKCAFKAVQSIACGLPVIVSDVGMNKEVVENNGFLVKEDSDWVTSVINLSKDKDNWEKNSINSRTLWEKKFNPQTVEKVLRQIVLD